MLFNPLYIYSSLSFADKLFIIEIYHVNSQAQPRKVVYLIGLESVFI